MVERAELRKLRESIKIEDKTAGLSGEYWLNSAQAWRRTGERMPISKESSGS